MKVGAEGKAPNLSLTMFRGWRGRAYKIFRPITLHGLLLSGICMRGGYVEEPYCFQNLLELLLFWLVVTLVSNVIKTFRCLRDGESFNNVLAVTAVLEVEMGNSVRQARAHTRSIFCYPSTLVGLRGGYPSGTRVMDTLGTSGYKSTFGAPYLFLGCRVSMIWGGTPVPNYPGMLPGTDRVMHYLGTRVFLSGCEL